MHALVFVSSVFDSNYWIHFLGNDATIDLLTSYERQSNIFYFILNTKSTWVEC